MKARYLIRLDDACPTMDHKKWEEIERLLDEHGIKPIVAVVPDNKDPSLVIDEYAPDFWDKVRLWKAKGWCIAMHGHTHVMHLTESKQIFPFYKRTEFSGLSYKEQSKKILFAYTKFKDEQVSPDAWIAPAHCFDDITLKVLRDCTDIRIISDSIALDIYYWREFYWIPQQLWSFKKLPFGLWTVCLHPNMMSIVDFNELSAQLNIYSKSIISFSDLNLFARHRSLTDRLVNAYYWFKRGEYRTGIMGFNK